MVLTLDEREEADRRKFNALAEELESIPDNIENLNPLERKGVYHAIQVAVDACMDLAAMVVKDKGEQVVDDYHNLEILAEAGAIDARLITKMKNLNGLRNAIVHRYNRFEDQVLKENIDEIKETIYEFGKQMEEAI